MKMRKAFTMKVLLALALLLGLLPGAGAGKVSTPASQPTQRLTARRAPAPPSSFAQRGSPAGSVRFAKRLIKERNPRRRYTVDASYPQLVGVTDANAVQFNRVVKDLLLGALNDFKKNSEPPASGVRKGVPWSSFDAGYTVEYDSPDLISIAFGVSQYYAGAAHPLPYSMVLNYDMKAGRTLSLSDLFKPRSNHLQVISDYALKALIKELRDDADREWIQTGAAPDSKNYKSWNITSRGLTVTFDPYQVTAYAYGEHVVVIPYAELRNIINTDGPLGPLAKIGGR